MPRQKLLGPSLQCPGRQKPRLEGTGRGRIWCELLKGLHLGTGYKPGSVPSRTSRGLVGDARKAWGTCSMRGSDSKLTPNCAPDLSPYVPEALFGTGQEMRANKHSLLRVGGRVVLEKTF